MAGSGFFLDTGIPHLARSHGGLSGEDIATILAPMAAITVEEFTNLAAPSTAGLLAATATTVAVQTITTFLAGGVAVLRARSRTVKFTTAGVTASDAPATCVVTGRDLHGNHQSETVTLAQTATSVETLKCYSALISVVYAAGDGAGATIAIGVGASVGLGKKLKARAGFNGFLREIVGGSVAGTPATIAVDEWTNVAALATAGLKVATATTIAVQVVLPGALLAGGIAALLAYPRNVTFTTAGTATDAPASVVILGTDINGAVLSETLVLGQTAGTDQGVKAFKTITSITFGAGVGAGGTVAIGFGKVFGLSRPIKLRGSATKVLQEIAIGVVVTTGTYVLPATSGPNGTYTPSANPNGTTDDFAVYYETTGGTSTVTSAATSSPNGSYTPSTVPDGAVDYAIYYEYDPAA